MCGVPVHAADDYLSAADPPGLQGRGLRADRGPGRGQEARRQVGGASATWSALVTPGTLTEESLLDARSHNYLAAIAEAQRRAGAAPGSTFRPATSRPSLAAGQLAAELARLAPGEVLVRRPAAGARAAARRARGWRGADAAALGALRLDTAARARCRRLNVAALDGFGDFSRAELGGLGALLDYVEITQAGRAAAAAAAQRARRRPAADRRRDAAQSRAGARAWTGERDGSLLAAIDRTVTGAGARLLASGSAARSPTRPRSSAGSTRCSSSSSGPPCASGCARR